jgi:ankyrin repeat protein
MPDLFAAINSGPDAVRKALPHCDQAAINAVLPLACMTGKVDVVKVLLEEGKADVNYLDADRQSTPLLIAIVKKQTAVVQLLLAAPGIHLDWPAGENGVTSLFAAVSDADMTKLLLDAGAKVDVRCGPKLNTTVLHIACERNQAAVLRLLLNAPGAAAALRFKDGAYKTPLEVTEASSSSSECADAIREHNASAAAQPAAAAGGGGKAKMTADEKKAAKKAREEAEAAEDQKRLEEFQKQRAEVAAANANKSSCTVQ